jgi:glycosyltransferase involved in cell wall biosynthesis
MEHKENGWLIDPADTNDIVNSIVYLLKNSDVREQIAEKGRLTVQQRFSINTVAEAYEKYYLSVIESK